MLHFRKRWPTTKVEPNGTAMGIGLPTHLGAPGSYSH